MWDKDVDGYARGEGIAAVVLKPLSAAIRDNDHIECLIRGTGVNQDGRTNGITMPSATAQAALMLELDWMSISPKIAPSSSMRTAQVFNFQFYMPFSLSSVDHVREPSAGFQNSTP